MKWSQDKLAEVSTVEVRTISNIERNVGNPTFENLFSLIKVLKIDSREVFNYEELHNAPTAYHLQQILLGCTEEEAQSLTDVSEVVLKAMRRSNRCVHLSDGREASSGSPSEAGNVILSGA